MGRQKSLNSVPSNPVWRFSSTYPQRLLHGGNDIIMPSRQRVMGSSGLTIRLTGLQHRTQQFWGPEFAVFKWWLPIAHLFELKSFLKLILCVPGFNCSVFTCCLFLFCWLDYIWVFMSNKCGYWKVFVMLDGMLDQLVKFFGGKAVALAEISQHQISVSLFLVSSIIKCLKCILLLAWLRQLSLFITGTICYAVSCIGMP